MTEDTHRPNAEDPGDERDGAVIPGAEAVADTPATTNVRETEPAPEVSPEPEVAVVTEPDATTDGVERPAADENAGQVDTADAAEAAGVGDHDDVLEVGETATFVPADAGSVAAKPAEVATATTDEAAEVAVATSDEATEPEAVAPVEPVAPAPAGDRFTWHPEHAGKTFDEVRDQLTQDIAADQRQHRLAMEGAEESEQDALASVVSLERKWGVYDFDWAEQDASELAGRILAFEQERERRNELITWADYRTGGGSGDAVAADAGERPAPELSSGAKALSLLLVVLLIALILIAVWAL